MRRDLDATIARERELLGCLGEALDEQVEKGEEAWRTRQIARMNRTLDELRAERKAIR